MPLLVNELKTALLESVYNGDAYTPVEAADHIMKSYVTYASKATTCIAGVPAFPGQALATASLVTAMSSPVPPALFAAAFATLWAPPNATFVPVGLAAPLPSAIALFTSTLAIQIASMAPNTNEIAATMLAAALHLFTTNVLVFHANAPPAIPPCIAPLA